MNLNKHELYCKQTLLQKFNKFYKLYKPLDEIQSEIFFLRTTNHQYLR